MSEAGRVKRAINTEDLRQLAKRRVPRAVFDYIDGGAGAEATLRDNTRAFDAVTFLPRGAIDTPTVDMKTTVVGTTLDVPFLLAPLGSSRVFYPRGEAAAARAAGRAGTGYVLSTLSGCALEEVKSATTGPAWYQVYLVGGRNVASAAIERAARAGFGALVVTIDTPVAGMRERDQRNGVQRLLSRNPVTMLPVLPQVLARPRWLAAFLADGGLMCFPNVVLPGQGPMAYTEVGPALEQSVVTWADLEWIRKIWPRAIVVKGVLTADDARRACDAGADAVIVSNHGGRQLDGVPASLRALPSVAEAVGGRIEVLMDGGIRRGSDIVVALCLGARAVLVGRAYGYGLAAAGEAGAARAIDILRADLVRTMKLLGGASTGALDRTYVAVPDDWRLS